jgi:tetratricopeptide (TPR) repeat protein
LNRLTFSPDNRRVLTTSQKADGKGPAGKKKPTSTDGRSYLWQLLPEDDTPIDVLKLRCQAIASRAIDATGTTTEFALIDLRDSWERLQFVTHPRSRFPSEERYIDWLKAQAQECAGARLWSAALLPLDDLVAKRPDDAYSRYFRGSMYAEQGQWDRAREDFDAALQRKDPPPPAWFSRATLDARAGDWAAYRKRCAALVERFGKTEDPSTALGLAMTCTLAPDALTDYSPLIELVKAAARKNADEANGAAAVLGIVLYRAGRLKEAATELEAVCKNAPQYGLSLPRLLWAMTLLGLKEKQATEQFSMCSYAFERLDGDRTGRAADDGLWWLLRVQHQLLFAEAKKLFPPDRPPPAPAAMPIPAPKTDVKEDDE